MMYVYDMTVEAAKSGAMAAHIEKLRSKAAALEERASGLRRKAAAQERLMVRILVAVREEA